MNVSNNPSLPSANVHLPSSQARASSSRATKTDGIFSQLKVLLEQIDGVQSLYGRYPAKQVKLLTNKHAMKAKSLKSDIANELSQAAAGSTEEMLRLALKQVSTAQTLAWILSLGCEQRILAETQGLGRKEWSPPNLKEIRHDSAGIKETMIADIYRINGSSSYFAPAVQAITSFFRAPENKLERIQHLIEKDLAECSHMQNLYLQTAQAYHLLESNSPKINNVRLDQARENYKYAGITGLACIELQFYSVHLRLLDALSLHVKKAENEAKNKAAGTAQSAYMVATVLDRQAMKMIINLMNFFSSGESPQEDAIAKLLTWDRNIEKLAEKVGAMSDLFPDGASEADKKALGDLRTKLLAMRPFIRSELEKRNYAPPEFSKAKPPQSSMQQKLLGKVPATSKSSSQKPNKETKQAKVQNTPHDPGSATSNIQSAAPDGRNTIVEIVETVRNPSISTEEEEPIDVSYFPHLRKHTDGAQTISRPETLQRSADTETKKLSEIAKRLEQPRYDLDQLGKIQKPLLESLVKDENHQLELHGIHTETLIDTLEKLIRGKNLSAEKKSGIQEKIKEAKIADKELQEAVSERQFPNNRAVRILLEAGKIQLVAIRTGLGRVTKDDKTGEFTTFDIYRFVFVEGGDVYAAVHAHYKCDANGNPLLDARGNKQYIDRPVFNENGELEQIGKAIHLKHPSQEDQGRNFEALNDENVHRWSVKQQDFQMMLATSTVR